MECFMDAFAFCIVVCLGIGAIALFVRIFNKGKSLSHARAEECNGGLPDVLTQPWYDHIPGNRYNGNKYFSEFRKYTGPMM